MEIRRNVFVLGLDHHNHQLLEQLPDAHRYRFHQLLTIEELQLGERIPLAELLDKAQDQLNVFDGSIDAIVGYWDFPVSSMVPMLCERNGLKWHPSLRAIVKCEHKYWSRTEQRKVLDEECPPFGLVDPDRDESPPTGVRYPMWIKPVKSFDGMLAYRASNLDEFQEALRRIRGGIGRISAAFDVVLDHVELPPEMARIGGNACIAEEALHGKQVTLEGYCYRGQPHVYGAVDSVTYKDIPSFVRFQYPSSLPRSVVGRMASVSKRVIRQLGLDDSTFNIEFFWDPDADSIGLLEVNPRHSQSHAALFRHVDGLPNHHCMLRLAFGRDPRLPHRQGRYSVAAKSFLRCFRDGVVLREPTESEIAAIEQEIPGTTIDLVAHRGDRLSALFDQDSYSYKLANIHIGAVDEAELIAKYHRCEQLLRYQIGDVPTPA
ncbi:ATP-grasp domain-containing protein [Streptomyces gobiensis]|uniref:ATP-grasp domain-containing protein n=1 Tax=Streptomyces gobiensis TaxID=2875706 RepID=UPI001E43B995|nr:ATP-grasp domain-containing protein [Streptomyces gobiensis]UGY90293.1 ATP-grasp domain-containing protein [Streptomyces gobiensis]